MKCTVLENTLYTLWMEYKVFINTWKLMWSQNGMIPTYPHTERNRAMVILESYWVERGNLWRRDFFLTIFFTNFLNKSDLVKGFPLLTYLNSNSGYNWEECG